MTIKSITVTLVAPMYDHAANRGEKLLGNASSIKRRPDGRVYISGQMQRHSLFSAIDRLNEDHADKKKTYVANGDGASTDIKNDLRSDLGGYLDPNKGDYSGRRTAPVTATPAVAKNASDVGRDLLVRLKMNENEQSKQKQALATNEFSQKDEMIMSFHLDIGAIGITKKYRYDGEKHVATYFEDHLEGVENERQRRIHLFLESTCSLTDYANQARNATSGEPQKVLIVLDTKLSRKAARYFSPDTTPIEQKNILAEIESRGGKYFLGDDTVEGDSVNVAYQKAITELKNNKIYNPAMLKNNQ